MNIMPTDDEYYALTDDHEFQSMPGWRRRENRPDAKWEPACCYRRPWMYPQQQYCGLPERAHRMRMLHGPILVPKDAVNP